MRMKIFITAIIIIVSTGAYAQNEKIKHFEIGLSAMFWSPAAQHLKSTVSHTFINPESGDPYTIGSLEGYGSSIAPGFSAKYYFNNDNLGIAFSFDMIHMDNELRVQKNETDFESFENTAEIPSLSIGLTGRSNIIKAVQFHYETGVRLIPDYSLEVQYSDNNSETPDLDAEDVAFGIYTRAGVDFKIVKPFYLSSSIEYSYIPVSIEYSTYNGHVKKTVKSNLGGVGLLT